MTTSIKAIQQSLKSKGLYAGEVDGIAGPLTWSAIHEAIVGSEDDQTVLLPPTQLDERSNRVIGTLHPAVREKFAHLITRINGEGLKLNGQRIVAKLISGYRSYEEQAALYAQGRTKPGKVVTFAPPGYSNHNFGLAGDIGLFTPTGAYIDDFPSKRDGVTSSQVHSLYRLCGPIGKAVGLDWGGDWDTPDIPHFQFRPDWAKGISEASFLSGLRARKASGHDLIA